MRTFFGVLAVVSCVFISHVEGIQQQSRVSEMKQTIAKQAVSQAEKNERDILLSNCWIVRSNIANYFSGLGSGARRSSAYINAVKQGIRDYLNSVGTQTARKLLSELEANGFQSFI